MSVFSEHLRTLPTGERLTEASGNFDSEWFLLTEIQQIGQPEIETRGLERITQ